MGSLKKSFQTVGHERLMPLEPVVASVGCGDSKKKLRKRRKIMSQMTLNLHFGPVG
jgi:hypothetical protein